MTMTKMCLKRRLHHILLVMGRSLLWVVSVCGMNVEIDKSGNMFSKRKGKKVDDSRDGGKIVDDRVPGERGFTTVKKYEITSDATARTKESITTQDSSTLKHNDGYNFLSYNMKFFPDFFEWKNRPGIERADNFINHFLKSADGQSSDDVKHSGAAAPQMNHPVDLAHFQEVWSLPWDAETSTYFRDSLLQKKKFNGCTSIFVGAHATSQSRMNSGLMTCWSENLRPKSFCMKEKYTLTVPSDSQGHGGGSHTMGPYVFKEYMGVNAFGADTNSFGSNSSRIDFLYLGTYNGLFPYVFPLVFVLLVYICYRFQHIYQLTKTISISKLRGQHSCAEEEQIVERKQLHLRGESYGSTMTADQRRSKPEEANLTLNLRYLRCTVWFLVWSLMWTYILLFLNILNISGVRSGYSQMDAPLFGLIGNIHKSTQRDGYVPNVIMSILSFCCWVAVICVVLWSKRFHARNINDQSPKEDQSFKACRRGDQHTEFSRRDSETVPLKNDCNIVKEDKKESCKVVEKDAARKEAISKNSPRFEFSVSSCPTFLDSLFIMHTSCRCFTVFGFFIGSALLMSAMVLRWNKFQPVLRWDKLGISSDIQGTSDSSMFNAEDQCFNTASAFHPFELIDSDDQIPTKGVMCNLFELDGGDQTENRSGNQKRKLLLSINLHAQAFPDGPIDASRVFTEEEIAQAILTMRQLQETGAFANLCAKEASKQYPAADIVVFIVGDTNFHRLEAMQMLTQEPEQFAKLLFLEKNNALDHAFDKENASSKDNNVQVHNKEYIVPRKNIFSEIILERLAAKKELAVKGEKSDLKSLSSSNMLSSSIKAKYPSNILHVDGREFLVPGFMDGLSLAGVPTFEELLHAVGPIEQIENLHTAYKDFHRSQLTKCAKEQFLLANDGFTQRPEMTTRYDQSIEKPKYTGGRYYDAGSHPLARIGPRVDGCLDTSTGVFSWKSTGVFNWNDDDTVWQDFSPKEAEAIDLAGLIPYNNKLLMKVQSFHVDWRSLFQDPIVERRENEDRREDDSPDENLRNSMIISDHLPIAGTLKWNDVVPIDGKYGYPTGEEATDTQSARVLVTGDKLLNDHQFDSARKLLLREVLANAWTIPLLISIMVWTVFCVCYHSALETTISISYVELKNTTTSSIMTSVKNHGSETDNVEQASTQDVESNSIENGERRRLSSSSPYGVANHDGFSTVDIIKRLSTRVLPMLVSSGEHRSDHDPRSEVEPLIGIDARLSRRERHLKDLTDAND